MGKGDTKTAKGKRVKGSYGNVRPKAKKVVKTKAKTTTTPKKKK